MTDIKTITPDEVIQELTPEETERRMRFKAYEFVIKKDEKGREYWLREVDDITEAIVKTDFDGIYEKKRLEGEYKSPYNNYPLYTDEAYESPFTKYNYKFNTKK